MRHRQQYINRSRGILLAWIMLGLTCHVASAQQTPTDQLRVLSENLKSEDLEAVRELIAAGADVNVRNQYRWTPLLTASWQGDAELVEAFLSANADMDIRLHDGRTSLWIAAANGHVDVVKALLDAGADINTANKHGSTSLHLAAQQGHGKIVAALLTAGADANLTFQHNDQPYTPLKIAIENGHDDIVKLLQEHGGK